MAAKTAEMLLMVGLPDCDSIRCRLLAGLWISSASASKPTVALTRSRRISFADSGSPLTNNVMACTPGRSAPGRLRPRRLHAAHAHRRDRIPEQGRRVCLAVRRRRRSAADHCRRPQAPRCSDRRHARAAHLGLGADASPPCARHRARRRPGTRRYLACLPSRILPARARALAPVSAALPRRTPAPAPVRATAMLRRARRAGRRAPSPTGSRPCAAPNGWSTPSARSPAPRPCWPTCRATRTGWRSPTADCSAWTRAA